MPTPPGVAKPILPTCGKPHPQPFCPCLACGEANRLADAATKYASVEDVAVDDELWAYARGWWRRARVVSILHTRVRVAYRLQGGRGLKTTDAPLETLRRFHFRPPAASAQPMPAPKLQEVQKP